ncbi:MAG: 1,4-dihydroxy-2-naphthoate octaprenyltransferase [Saprospirales bacterium]|nr:MAG: 1,4-dihydroxy-2-naphthoate octaprenyltransferase [Saprospirales bacterium]
MASTPLKAWISAARLRTLPLAVAATLMGNILVHLEENMRIDVLLLSILTAVLIQILSNYANDYGDFQKGVDNENRLGPLRVMQGGLITQQAMLRAIKILVVLSFVSGLSLLWLALGTEQLSGFIFLTLLGILAIWAAISYTATKNPYGYKGLGDLFVFLFFGLAAIVGNYYLQTQSISSNIFFPAAAIGFLSTAVLNLNNMRDHDNDKATNKKTLVVILGSKNALFYHYFLVLSALAIMLIYMMNQSESWGCFLFLLVYPVFFIHLFTITKKPKPQILNGQLKVVSLATFGLVILLTISILTGLC